jgi:hypothetical protein
MTTLEITDEQASFLDALRDAIEEELVGPYGTVERNDALQYLIDNYGEPDELLGDADAAEAAAEGSASADAEAEAETEGAASEEADDGDADADDEADADDDEPDDGKADAADEGGGAPTPTPGGGGGDGMLDEMMRLMETHDDKWEQANSEETRYEVELPDGDVETVQTQDDVRALLFKNYR